MPKQKSIEKTVRPSNICWTDLLISAEQELALAQAKVLKLIAAVKVFRSNVETGQPFPLQVSEQDYGSGLSGGASGVEEYLQQEVKQKF